MKVLAILFVILIQFSFLIGQDGSDLFYIKPDKINNSLIGRKLHLDFYNITRGYLGEKRLGDKITINLKGKNVIFIENRTDDGYNNWFSKQYLESVKNFGNLKLRIKEFELLEIQQDNILVKVFFIFVNKNGKVLVDKSFTQNILFAKKNIVECLLKAKD